MQFYSYIFIYTFVGILCGLIVIHIAKKKFRIPPLLSRVKISQKERRNDVSEEWIELITAPDRLPIK